MNRTVLKFVAICAAILGWTDLARAQSVPIAESVALHVRELSFDPLKAPPAVHASLRATAENGYAIVQYHPSEGAAVHRALIAAQARIYGPVARHGFLVGNITQRQLKAIKGVRFAGPFHPAYKLEPSLRARAIKPGAAKIRVAVDVFENAPRVAKTISAYAKATLVGAQQEHLLVELAERDLKRLAAVADVRNIEPAMMPKPELDVMPSRIGVRTAARQPNFMGLDGTGQKLGVYDTGADTGDTTTLVLDLRNRVSGDIDNWANPSMDQTWADLSYSGGNANHGTSVTDIAIGNGATSSTALLTGIAPAATAKIRSFNADAIGLVPGYLNINQALTNAYNWGANVHNNSWVPATGTAPDLTPVLNVYSQQATVPLDQFAYTNWRMLILTSAGNYGEQGANTIGTLSCSKNSLSVGNSGNGNPPSGRIIGDFYDGVAPNTMEPSSSIGPVPGGRLRPDVVAPGQEIASPCTTAKLADHTCPDDNGYLNEPAYKYGGGASFSTPAVSGMALLLRQLLARDTNLPNASGMLVKSLLVNGAAQMFNYAPGNAQGWGQVSLPRSINGFTAGDVYYYDSMTEHGAAFRFVQAGQSVVFENVVLAQGVPFYVTLTWFDPPDATLAGRIVNDLDLTLTLQNGTVYRGGVPSMQNGVTVANGAGDHVNNTEKLILAATPAQPVTLTVTASVVNVLYPQAFALAVSSVTSHDLKARSVSTTPRAPGTRAVALHRLRAAAAIKTPPAIKIPPTNKPTKPAIKVPPTKPALKPQDKRR